MTTFAASTTAFDPSRAILRPEPPLPLFHIQQTMFLEPLVSQGEILPETSLQVITIDGQPYAFLTRELIMFDVAQFDHPKDPWIVTFCPICNAGACFSSRIGEELFHFALGGIYNAMAIIRDKETGSYWDHIHGRAMYGPSLGKQLPFMGVLRHLIARDALQEFPTIVIARAPLTDEHRATMAESEEFRTAAQPTWSPRLTNTLVHEDNRLPRYDMGLGVWLETPQRVARYYSILTINAADNAVIDTIEGRSLLVYFDLETGIPDAFFTEATSFKWIGEQLHLDNGVIVAEGRVRDKTGKGVRVERPLQLFQRWYGFAAMFPNCTIYSKNQ
ncbi:MAG TPA: DUF3179 domain-containing (seleno)protein [Aggregatilineales bacterium]|nr:DUF3179 domain-containing protein [Anaerolineales bacterium]HRE46273.1 DUF3179 domain-containing (seleno)protein [Aggregatilineales bacterium]